MCPLNVFDKHLKHSRKVKQRDVCLLRIKYIGINRKWASIKNY